MQKHREDLERRPVRNRKDHIFEIRGYVKDKVFATFCPNLTYLKRRTTTKISRSYLKVLEKVCENSKALFSTVIRENGGHFGHI